MDHAPEVVSAGTRRKRHNRHSHQPLWRRLAGAYGSIVVIATLVFGGLFLAVVLVTLRAGARDEAVERAHLVADAVSNMAESQVRDRLTFRLSSALYYLNDLQRLVRAGTLESAAAEEQAKSFLRDFRWTGDGYFYVLSREANLIVHPEPELEGTYVGNYAFVLRQVTSPGGFTIYDWANPGEPEPRTKIGLSASFEPFEWIVVASDYLHGSIESLDGETISALLSNYAELLGGTVLLALDSGAAHGSSRSDMDAIGAIETLVRESDRSSPIIKRRFGRELRILGIAGLSPYGAKVGVVSDSSKTERVIGFLVLFIVLALVVVTSGTLLISRRVAKNLTAPIRKLAARLQTRDENPAPISDFSYLVRRQLRSIVRLEFERSRRKQAEQELEIAESVFRYTTEGIIVTDTNGTILRVNKAFGDLTGYPAHEMHGKNPRILQSGRHGGFFYKEMWAALERDGHWIGEVVNKHKDGHLYEVLLAVGSVTNHNGTPERYVGIFHDVSQIKDVEGRLNHLATHDQLTGLPNRRALLETLNLVLKINARRALQTAVLFLDLDNFKDVNDSYGHTAGDELLRQVAERISRTVRGEDYVAHFGADEFVIVLAEVQTPNTTLDVVRRLLLSVGEPLPVGRQVIRPKATVGIATYPSAGEDTETLLKNADAAMCAAKRETPGSYRYYEAAMNRKARIRLTIQDEVRRAIASGNLEMRLQPILQVQDRILVAAEALVRWKRGDQLLQPADFLPDIENSGAMSALGQWMVRTALSFVNEHRSQLPRGFHVSVNISAGELADPDHIGLLLSEMSEAGMDFADICIEVTESEAIHDFSHARTALKTFQDHGIPVYLDDFGEGYASLRYLRELGADVVKLDKSFLSGIPGSSRAESLLRAFVGMAHGLDMQALAEGVETAAQAESIHRHGFALMQGFWLSKPLTPEEFIRRYGTPQIPVA